MSHHSEHSELLKRFGAEMERRARRRWPDGRAGPEDDGETVYGIAHDQEHHIVRLEFSKPMDWLGLDVKAATELRNRLNEFLLSESEQNTAVDS
jgi:hypothetical protein